MYYAFIFHFLIGLLVYSNDRILSSSEKDDFKKIDKSLFSIERYQRFHVLLFVCGNVFLLLLYILKTTVFKFFVSKLEWLSDL